MKKKRVLSEKPGPFRRYNWPRMVVCSGMAILFFAAPVNAQTLTRDPTEKPAPSEEKPAHPAARPSAGAPLEITADGSLEWQRNEKIFIARKNALAKQGDSSIAAATLTAHYTEKKGGGMKISQVHAEDNVVIHAKATQASGSRADYDLDKGYAVMTGENLRMISPDQEVTAQQKFEYWVHEGRFTAAGRAKVTRATDTLEADTISAVMKNDAQGQRVLDMLQADGNVIITTPTETASGAHAVYRASTNKAELTGAVKILRGPNILEGDRAEVDMTTNISQIFGSEKSSGRVKAIFYPGSGKNPER